MSRKFFVELHMINVSADPHPAGVYEDLLKRSFNQRQPIEIRGERSAIMTDLGWRKSKKTGKRVAAYGVISTFTDIDVDAPWLNRKTGKAAAAEETNKIVIPEALRPHFSQFQFYFSFEKHILVFQGRSRMPKKTGGFKIYSLSPLLMKKYLDSLFLSPEVKGNLRAINVTIVPDPSKLKEILESKNIREITMTVTVPNSDNIAVERGRVRQRMERINAKRRVEVYTAADGDGVKPDAEMIKAAEVSALDGRVTARVATNDGVIPLSTADAPLTERVEIDPNVELEISTIRRNAERLARSFKAS